MKAKYKFLAEETRHQMTIFDVDDSLVVTKSKIKVIDHENGKTIKLTPQEFNDYEQKANHELDFSEFNDPEILRGGLIIDWVFDILRKTLEKSKKVNASLDRISLIIVMLNIRYYKDFVLLLVQT